MSVEEQLDPGEQLQWQGRPAQGLLFRGRDAFLIPFALLWAGFVVFWNLMVWDGYPWLFRLWGLPFLAVGFHIVIGRFIADALLRGRTQYAITNSRAIIWGGLFARKLNSMPLTANLQIEVSGTERGSIKFGANPYPLFDGRSANFKPRYDFFGRSHPFMFERIENVREVCEIVRRVQTSHG